MTGVTVQQGRVDEGDATPVDTPAMDRESESELDIPADVASLIDSRTSAWVRPLARRFAAEAIALEGVYLQVQQGQGAPWYFHVRHPRFGAAVAYVNPRQTELTIEYRLPSSHDAYGAAQRRDGRYGIVTRVRQSADLPTALRLLRDTLESGA